MKNVKKVFSMAIITFFLLCSVGKASTKEKREGDDSDFANVTIDVLLARPFGLVGTVFGTAAFIASLPWAIPTKSVKKCADTLIVKQAKWTFTRPVGQF
ncbi:MAG: hypothetical protein V1872_03840 [bacterium]